MKNKINFKLFSVACAVVACGYSCKKTTTTPSVSQFNIMQTNLVGDVASSGAAKVDAGLLNAWGLARNPAGPIWVSGNHSGLSTVYDATGATVIPPVTIPAATAGQTGSPTGVVFNGTADFGGNKFLFASEDGIISAWTAGTAAVKVADQSQANAVYKGLALATDGGNNFLYAANFKGNKIDVFDKNFNLVTTKPFADPNIPAGFAPFNIQCIAGQLYVTYAKLMAPNNEDDQAGPGNGYVDIFSPNGTLVKRFASQGTLNSPWGITQAPAGFANAQSTILVGNFGDGKINVFDTTGNYLGQLQNNGAVITIPGLWAIDFLKNGQRGSSTDPLFFTAGPGGEAHGLFGTLTLYQPVAANPGQNNGGYGY